MRSRAVPSAEHRATDPGDKLDHSTTSYWKVCWWYGVLVFCQSVARRIAAGKIRSGSFGKLFLVVELECHVVVLLEKAALELCPVEYHERRL